MRAAQRKETVRKYQFLFFREYLEALVVVVLLVAVLRVFFIGVYRMPGKSMWPTLIPGDYMIGIKTSYGFKIPFFDARFGAQSPRRDDIVSYRNQSDRSIFVKRVVGLPGDVVSMSQKNILVNGKPLRLGSRSSRDSKGMLEKELKEVFQTQIVAPGEIFLMDDLGLSDADSRHWQIVSISQIEARVALILFSFGLANSQGHETSADSPEKVTLGGELPAESQQRMRWERIFRVL